MLFSLYITVSSVPVVFKPFLRLPSKRNVKKLCPSVIKEAYPQTVILNSPYISHPESVYTWSSEPVRLGWGKDMTFFSKMVGWGKLR